MAQIHARCKREILISPYCLERFETLYCAENRR